MRSTDQNRDRHTVATRNALSTHLSATFVRRRSGNHLCSSSSTSSSSSPKSRLLPKDSLSNLPSHRQIQFPLSTTTTTMKFFFAIAAALVAVTSAVDCDLLKVAPLLSDKDVLACSSATGFVPPKLPAEDKLPAVCANANCKAALGKLKALNLGDCVALGVALESGLITPIEKFCAKNSASPTPAPVTPGTPSTPAPAGSTPSATTVKPAC